SPSKRPIRHRYADATFVAGLSKGDGPVRVATALLLVELSLAGATHAATVSEGRASYDDNRVAEAEKIYAGVTADRAAGAAERAAAERELARIAWLIDGDSKRALTHLA